MTTHLTKRKTPEMVEAEAKQAELAALEGRFAEIELELATAQAELQAFERGISRHSAVVSRNLTTSKPRSRGLRPSDSQTIH